MTVPNFVFFLIFELLEIMCIKGLKIKIDNFFSNLNIFNKKQLIAYYVMRSVVKVSKWNIKFSVSTYKCLAMSLIIDSVAETVFATGTNRNKDDDSNS